MRPGRLRAFTGTILLAILLGGGCRQKEHDPPDHADKDAGHGHGHEAAGVSGASFKSGQGVMLTEETRQSLGLETIEVTEKELRNELQFTMQVFGEKHHHPLGQADHSGCDVYGSGFLSSQAAAPVKAGQRIDVLKGKTPLVGVVVGVQKALALGESEVVVGISNAAMVLKEGEFIPARVSLARQGTVPVIPKSALLRTAEGTFVYVVNGEAYLRIPVKTGAVTEGWVEIADGLLSGDEVVTKPVQTLWLIELRATKGGGHSH